MSRAGGLGRYGSAAPSAALPLALLAFGAPAHAESRKHDGIYASADMGVGYVTSSGDSNPSKLSGVSTPLSLWLGYTFGPVALGGGAFTDSVWWPSYDARDPPTFDEDLGFALFGFAAFADIYPDPKGGFHIMPTVGWAYILSPTEYPSGLALGVGVGYDFWVASEWSLGAMARFTYAPLTAEAVAARNRVPYPTFAPELLFTVTYH